jgi:hypothetical protein
MDGHHGISHMKKHALSIGAAIVIAAVFALQSWATCDWSWFQRSGTLVGVVGVLIESWQMVLTEKPDDLPMWSTAESHSGAKVAIAIGCVGALIQGYGDLIGKLYTCAG